MLENQAYNPLPDIGTYYPNNNPTLFSPNAEYQLPFYQTKESLQDLDIYRTFIKSIESMFRRSIRYKKYKGYIYENGMNKSQVHGYINADMAPLEMHHAIFNLYELSLILTEYLLNTVGYVTTFDVVRLLKQEHSLNNIALVILDETSHSVYHNSSNFFIHPKMVIGNWKEFVIKYKSGFTQELAYKLLFYINKALKTEETDDGGLLELREEIKKWSF